MGMKGEGSNRQGGWGRSCRIYVCLPDQWAHLTRASWTMEGSAWLLDRTGHNKTPGCGGSWSYGERPPSCTCLVPGDEWNRPTIALKGVVFQSRSQTFNSEPYNRVANQSCRGTRWRPTEGCLRCSQWVWPSPGGEEHSLEAMTSADNVSIGEGKPEGCPPDKGSCRRAQRGEGGANLRRAAVLNGAGAGEVADVVGHVENLELLELLQRMIQNLERELKGTIDSFDVRLQHN